MGHRGGACRLRALVAGCLLAAGCGGRPAAPPPRTAPARVVLCLARQPPSALAILASQQGFFRDEGLAVQVRPYPSGKRALDAMLDGEGDLATTATVPVALRSFDSGGMAVLCQIGSAPSPASVVCRRDRGISGPRDLRGRRIATQRASAVHFMLHLFLLHQGIADGEVETVFLPAEELAGAVARGEADAGCLREPFLSRALALLGPQAVTFAIGDAYAQTDVLVMSAERLRREPDTAARVVRALLRAEAFARRDPARAVGMACRALGINPEAPGAWPQAELAVRLEQRLLLALEDEAQWAVEGRLVPARPTPNFLALVRAETLLAERPQAVTLIR